MKVEGDPGKREGYRADRGGWPDANGGVTGRVSILQLYNLFPLALPSSNAGESGLVDLGERKDGESGGVKLCRFPWRWRGALSSALRGGGSRIHSATLYGIHAYATVQLLVLLECPATSSMTRLLSCNW